MSDDSVKWYQNQQTITSILNLIVAAVFQVIALVNPEGGVTGTKVDYVAVALVASTAIQKILQTIQGTEVVKK